MTTAIAKYGVVALQTPYHPQFVADLKAEIAYKDRQWDRDAKVWLVDEAEADKAIKIAAQFFNIQDCRGKGEAEVEDTALEAEIAKIEADQQYILESEDKISEWIDALDAQIGRYSFSSKSSVKGRMCRDRALLAHSLDNAKTPVEQLVELQVRGLAAAVRLLQTNTIRQLTSRN